MKISVIIPTYNGAHRISTLLRSLSEQTVLPDEIIVVVDGSTDNTLSVLSGWQQQLPQLKVITQSNLGRAVVRNTGAFSASGDLLLFFDDDTTLDPDCVAVHHTHHQSNYGSILTGPVPDCVLDTDFRRYKAMLSEKWTKPLTACSNKPLSRELIFITAANFSVPKHVFLKVGGFDARLRDCEDFDLGVRAFEQGCPIFYSAKAVAWHRDNISLRTYVKRLTQYRQALLHLYSIRASLSQLMPERYPRTPKGFKRYLFQFFSGKYWLLVCETSFFQKFVPRLIRYRVYDLVTTGHSLYP